MTMMLQEGEAIGHLWCERSTGCSERVRMYGLWPYLIHSDMTRMLQERAAIHRSTGCSERVRIHGLWPYLMHPGMTRMLQERTAIHRSTS